MRTNEFNNFFNGLKTDRETYEHFGFAFLQLTEKQTKKVIDYYKSINLYSISENPYTHIKFITFGTNGMFIYPYERYLNIK